MGHDRRRRTRDRGASPENGDDRVARAAVAAGDERVAAAEPRVRVDRVVAFFDAEVERGGDAAQAEHHLPGDRLLEALAAPGGAAGGGEESAFDADQGIGARGMGVRRRTEEAWENTKRKQQDHQARDGEMHEGFEHEEDHDSSCRSRWRRARRWRKSAAMPPLVRRREMM